MKISLKECLVLPVVVAALTSVPTGPATAQTFTTVYGFPDATYGTAPEAALVLSNSALYGTAQYGGDSGNGTVFRVNRDGTGFTNLYSFTAVSGFPSVNSDGAGPHAGLILSGNTLYGAAGGGGAFGNGTLFKVNTDGTGFTNLYNFTATSGAYATNSDGTGPQARLILLSNKLYGTAAYGGNSGSGTIFAINTDGTGFTNLYSFTATSSNPPYTNSDGEYPLAGLLLVGNTLYGTAQFGGGSGNGTVFKVNTDGTGFTALHSFTASSGSQQTNSDGTGPEAGLVFLNNALYGTASYGGSSGNGTVFKVNMDGTGFSTLHSFTAASGVLSTNTDGAYPLAGLFLSGTTLYGTAQLGGNSGSGTVFKLNMDGTGFTTLYSFTGNSDGSSPYAGLILSSNILYGTAMTGGSSGNGTVFSLSLAVSNLPQQPLLTITRSQSNLLLTWPTNFTGFTLQSTTNFSSPAWTNVSPGPVVINGQNTVTNPIFGPRKFFRLVH